MALAQPDSPANEAALSPAQGQVGKQAVARVSGITDDAGGF